jgi:hypothetical protein
MNKRIKELAKQAGGNPNYKAFRGHFLPPPPDYIDPATLDLEKFAELIVRECADWIDRQDESRCPYGIDLLEHFGVE